MARVVYYVHWKEIKWSYWKLYWQEMQSQQSLEWGILHILWLCFANSWEEFLKASCDHQRSARVCAFARQVNWSSTTRQVWSISQFLCPTLWMRSKSIDKLICNKARHFIWHQRFLSLVTVLERLQANGTDVELNIAGTHGMKDLKDR